MVARQLDSDLWNDNCFCRGTVLDGLYGRGNNPVFIPQPRRQAPGWDGCRDRADGRTDLKNELMWEHPGHRSDARVSLFSLSVRRSGSS